MKTYTQTYKTWLHLPYILKKYSNTRFSLLNCVVYLLQVSLKRIENLTTWPNKTMA